MKFDTTFNAYWISPKAEIFCVSITHIKYIMDNPKSFLFSYDKIVKVFEEYNESIGFEGKARDTIMKELITNGWIRIRKNRNYWTVQMNQWNEGNQSIIKQFTSAMINCGHSSFTEIRILTITENLDKTFQECT